MEWALVSVVGFVLATALVTALARSNTARWERRSRAAQAVVRDRDEALLRLRIAAILAPHRARAARRGPRGPTPHLRLPRVHVPARVAERLAHGREALHLPHLTVHLPHPDGRIARRLPGRRRREEDRRQGADAGDGPA